MVSCEFFLKSVCARLCVRAMPPKKSSGGNPKAKSKAKAVPKPKPDSRPKSKPRISKDSELPKISEANQKQYEEKWAEWRSNWKAQAGLSCTFCDSVVLCRLCCDFFTPNHYPPTTPHISLSYINIYIYYFKLLLYFRLDSRLSTFYFLLRLLDY